MANLDAEALSNVLHRLESLSREAIEKNGLLAKAALKLGENLALEQKRLADIASYEQQAAVMLAAIRQQGDQQIHILNQLVEAQYSTTDKEEFRALASHFYRAFDTLMGDVRSANQSNQEATLDRISRLGLTGLATNISADKEEAVARITRELKNDGSDESTKSGAVASVKGQPVNPLAPSNDESHKP